MPVAPGPDGAHALRQRMVDGLVESGAVTDPAVAAALRAVPRHRFVPEVAPEEAYRDQAIPTKYREGRTTSSSSQPAIVACMLEQLGAGPGHRILEIGAGTGYNAALLGRLVGGTGSVVTVDIDEEVAARARAQLAAAGADNVLVRCADGAGGWPPAAPYDGIIVTAGAPDLAPAWFDQLAPGGRLVLPLSLRGSQQCVAFAWAGDHLESQSVCDCGFMPLQGTLAPAELQHRVPGWAGVTIPGRDGLDVDVAAVARALSAPGPLVSTGVAVTAMERFGSLHRWLALGDPRTVQLVSTGPPDVVRAGPVPALLEMPCDQRSVQRATVALLGDGGLAALERDGWAGDPGPEAPMPLAARSFGSATAEAERLVGLVLGWDAAGRPPTGRLRIAAHRGPPPAGSPPGIVERTRHTTFVVSIG